MSQELIDEARSFQRVRPRRVLVPLLADALESALAETELWKERHEADEAALSRALGRLDAIRARHRPWYETNNGIRHDLRACIYVDDLPEGHVCLTDGVEQCDPDEGEHYALACVECRQFSDDGDGYLLWPCPTALDAGVVDGSETP